MALEITDPIQKQTASQQMREELSRQLRATRGDEAYQVYIDHGGSWIEESPKATQ